MRARRLAISAAVAALAVAPVAVVLHPAAASATTSGTGLIAFTRTDYGTHTSDIFVAHPDGTGVEALTAGEGDTDTEPSWSPDGSKLAFTYHPSLGWESIAVINADGTGLQVLTSDGDNYTEPAWSPDGTKIAFDEGGQIGVMNADGSDLVQLTSGYADSEPSWSPDGTKIVFQRFDPVSRDAIQIVSMNADGSDQTDLTSDPDADSTEPRWSPDGSKIAFERPSNLGVPEIWVMDADGTDQSEVSAPSYNAVDPTWSPDGTKIAFTAGTPTMNHAGIGIMNADGSGASIVTTGASYADDQPTWSPDSTEPTDVAPTLSILGDDSMTAGLDKTYSITNTGMPLSRYTWSTTPSNCLISESDLTYANVQCPAEDRGTVTVTLTGAMTGNPTAYTASKVITLSPATPQLSLSKLDGTDVGDEVVIQGEATADGVDLMRGTMTISRSLDGGSTWTTLNSAEVMNGSMQVTDQPDQADVEYKMTFDGASTTLDVVLDRLPSTATMTSTGQGRTAAFNGTLTTQAGPDTGATVSLQEERLGSTTWKSVSSATTADDGTYSLTYPVNQAGKFRWFWAGDSVNDATTSPTATVKAYTSLSASETTKKKIETLKATLRDGTGAALAKQGIRLQEKEHGAWKTIKNLITSSAGNATYTNKKAGKLEFRFSSADTTSYLSSTSKTLKAS